MAYNYNDPFVVETAKHGTGTSLNMRQYASTNAMILIQIPNLTEIMCDAEQESDDWMPCKYEGWRGFVQSKFLRGTEAYGSTSSTGAGNYDGVSSVDCKAIVRGGSLNLRASESTDSSALASIPNGTTIDVSSYTCQMAVWLRAVYNNKLGYVMHQYIEILDRDSYVVQACMRYGAALLKKGMSGSNVRQLAEDLRNYGGMHNLPTGTTFTDELDQAVRSFQAQHGLDVDGVVGNATKECLYDIVNGG